MDIFDRLKDEHDHIRQVFSELLASESAGDREQRQPLFRRLKDMLLTHGRAEEETFYAWLDDAIEGGDDRVAEARSDHAMVETYLNELESLDDDDSAGWLQKLHALREHVDRHIVEEEDTLFALGRDVLTEADADELERRLEDAEVEYRPQA